MDHSNLKEMGIPDHLTCLLRNLYADQEVAVRTGHGTTDWFQIMKGVHQGCIFRSLKQFCNFTSISECPERAAQPPISTGIINGQLAACEPQPLN